jgi:hypothetical protein
MIMPPSAIVTEHRDEAERLAKAQQRRRHADDAQRRGDQHHEGQREALQLDHQQPDHQREHHRHARIDRALRLDVLFVRAADLDPVARRQRARMPQLRIDRIATSGACTPSTMSARTVSVGVRLRRQRIGSSMTSPIRATWDSGTERPSAVWICRLATRWKG